MSVYRGSRRHFMENIDAIENKLYLAPLEEVTGYVFRSVFAEFYGGVDVCYTPFIYPDAKLQFRTRDIKEFAPENNQAGSFRVVPQLLTNDAEAFIATARHFKSLGYDEVNLNLGCPSNTVFKKRKGSGFLAVPDKLAEFLDEICEKSDIDISIKTRIGVSDPEEFMKLAEIFAAHPIKELIIHPRLKIDGYKGPIDYKVFAEALSTLKMPICYNGDIKTPEDYERIKTDFPGVSAVMIGRGAVADPGVFEKIKGAEPKETDAKLWVFEQALSDRYVEALGPKDALFKMKEVWSYLSLRISDACFDMEPSESRDIEKSLKEIRKTMSPDDFRREVGKIRAILRFANPPKSEKP